MSIRHQRNLGSEAAHRGARAIPLGVVSPCLLAVRLLAVCLLTVCMTQVRPARAYDVVVAGSRETVNARAIGRVDEKFVLLTDVGVETIPAGDIDFYNTFVRNLAAGTGNVVVFRNGRFFRFESLRIANGYARVELGGGSSFTISERLIDFEASVLEGALVQLPKDAGGEVAVAKARAGLSRKSSRPSRRGSKAGAAAVTDRVRRAREAKARSAATSPAVSEASGRASTQSRPGS